MRSPLQRDLVGTLAHDARYGFRALRNGRIVSILVVAALALGIGANTAIFTITHALVLRSLPVKDPARLLNVQIGNFMSWGSIEADNSFSWPLWTDFTRRQDVLTDVFGYAETRFDAVLNGQARQVTLAFVTGPMFRTLGLDPIVGRAFESEGPEPESAAQAVISYAFWTREFASDPDVRGRTVLVEGKPLVIVGVLPPRFFGLTVGHAVDLYSPIGAEPYIRGADSTLTAPTHYWLQVFGRPHEGIPLEHAQQRLTALSTIAMAATLPAELPERVRPQYLAQRFTLVPAAAGVSYFRTSLQIPLAVLSAIAGLLLVLTCLTVANLLLARGTARRQEIAVRIALGAGRTRIVRQTLIEGFLLAALGAAAGLLLARFASAFLVRSYSVAADPLMLDLSPDRGVFGFTLALAVATALVFGSVPALRASQVHPADALRGGKSTATASVLGTRRLLLAAQIAVSVVLVTGAVLFGATLRNLLSVDRGFQSERVVLAQIDLRRARLAPTARPQFYTSLLERVSRLPLVESASLAYVTPISGRTWQFDGTAETATGPKPVHIHYNAVTPEFFKTMGTPILAGRGFTAADNRSGARVALVNVTLARAAFGTTEAIGRRMRLLDPEPCTVEIVGIVQDAKYRSLRRPVPPTLYAAMAQHAEPPGSLNIAVRSRAGAPAIARDISTMLTREYPAVSYQVTSFNAQIADSIARERAFAFLCGLFAAVALALAAIGIYGVLSYFIAQRKAEIGIRMALGATPESVRRLVYRQSLFTCAAGLALGSLLAFWGGRYTNALLYGVTSDDPLVYAAAAAAIAIIAALATAVPALRASHSDWMRALRDH